jgi:anti-sigma regulatory factor (Ser/Thr protein kinase)
VASARKPATRTSTQLPHAPTSAGLARRFVAATLHRLELDGLVEEVALLAGELVTNAIAHTPASPVVLVVDWGDQVVRVEVHDGSPQLPRLNRLAGLDDEAGRGLGLVAALATRWGVDAVGRDDGKAVWFEVEVPGD